MAKKIVGDSIRKQYDRQNAFNRDNYDRINTYYPIGTKERIKDLGYDSVNGFIASVVLEKLDMLEAERISELTK